MIDQIIKEYRDQGLLNEKQLEHLRQGLEEVKDLIIDKTDLDAYALGYVMAVHLPDNKGN